MNSGRTAPSSPHAALLAAVLLFASCGGAHLADPPPATPQDAVVEAPHGKPPRPTRHSVVDAVPTDAELPSGAPAEPVPPQSLQSATTLTGSVHLLLAFTRRNGEGFTEREREQRVEAVDDCMDWIALHAVRRGLSLSWTISTLATEPVADEAGTDEDRWEDLSEDALRHVVATTGGDARQLHEDLGADQLVLLLFHPGRGRAFAMPSYTTGEYLEAVAVFERHRNGASCGTSLIAHELLHLFGAADLYTDVDGTSRPNDFARKHCPRDIMARAGDLHEVDLGDHTAQLIGWPDVPENAVAFVPEEPVAVEYDMEVPEEE